MSRADDLFGAGDPDALFQGKPGTLTPWPSAGRRKDRKDFEEDKVNAAVSSHQETEPVDPRDLYATQPGLSRAGVDHYLRSTEVYADAHQPGNARPVVYDRNGTKLILSGHHRAAARLLRGEQFDAVVVHGDWGPAR